MPAVVGAAGIAPAASLLTPVYIACRRLRHQLFERFIRHPGPPD